MSHNLTCEEFEPVQTPSWITELILSPDDDGNPMGGSEGVYKRYVLWLNHVFQETFNSVPKWNWSKEEDKHAAIREEQEWQRELHNLRVEEAKVAHDKCVAEGRELRWGST